MENVRLAFCGASGTGKSTLALAVSERLSLPMCPIGSREVSKAMGFANPYDVDVAGRRKEFQLELLIQKRAWEKDKRQFVSDRTHFDNLTYTSMHAPDLASEHGFIESVLQSSQAYTHIVFCPINAVHEIGDDVARVRDSAYHERYEEILLNLLLDYAGPMPVLMLTAHERDLRLNQVLRFVQP